MPETLTIGIVTRGRKKVVAQTALETLKNVREKGTKIVILADHDDDLEGLVLPEGVILNVGRREDSVAGKWNRMLRLFPADVYMGMCDYRYQATPGFDTRILEGASLFKDGIGCVVQHLANLSFPAYQCVTSKMAEIMGHFYVEHFPYWFVDHWLDDICKMTGRYVYAEGETAVFPRPGNGGTQDFREPALWASLYDALCGEREEIANRLLAEMDITDDQRAILRAQWPLIHQRSRMINGMVRGMEGNAPHDERYNRIRAKGVEKLTEIYNELTEKRAA
jgi:hypothetical protein